LSGASYLAEDLAGVSDVDGGLHLVARQHAHLDARRRKVRDGLRHAVLCTIGSWDGASLVSKNLKNLLITTTRLSI
jgi:hypothetical protein